MAESFAIEAYVFKWLARGVAGMLLIAALAYPLDWAVWRVRVARGGGLGAVEVEMFTVAELKGGKEDYYPNGTAVITCSKSLYPQGGNGACWWVQRHREVTQHY